ncbi:LysR family transcriptional regulator [Pseudoduganella violaceinigra]|uniref:LysR family transcriptional regulator n=1 Tax=Pseudoduganella violaceinigra TaxID=246602 RepID=UPI000424C0A7|nr:LysR family transcriptional regulator [Pseudoduganella violaceinigra]
MNLADLRIFVSVARSPSLAAAALESHLTPSAVSKALKRLEENVGMPLFDRSAKALVLNQSGTFLLSRAQTLLALADQAREDLQGGLAAIDCRVGGPAVLLWRHGRAMGEALQAWPQASLRMQAMFEDEALAALARGDLNAAIVTREAIDGRGEHWSEAWSVTPLGSVVQHLVGGVAHPLVQQLAAAGGRRQVPAGEALQASTAQVLAHDFACPPRSMFCGVQRGARSDGWRDDQLPRKIRYWTDDIHLLLGFVKSGAALAYLPDFALEDEELVRIHVSDCAYQCVEQVALVWNRAHAAEWMHQLAGVLA